MGKTDLEAQAKILEKAAKTAYMKYDASIKRNLSGTPQADEYEAAKKRYDPDGCADALSDMASTLRGMARRVPARRRTRR